MEDRFINSDFKEYLEIFPAVGILGPRQVGKTTFAKNFDYNDEIIYLDLENLADREKLKDIAFYLSQHQDKIIVFDEVQFMPSIFPALRGIIDQNKKAGRFILLGSATPDLIRSSAETLAGRIGYLNLNPFLLTEVDGDYQKHWLRGGFPLSYLASSDRTSVIWRRNFIQTYIQRDLGLLGLNADPQLIEKFWRMLASFHGNIWNAENFARSLGITRPTVNRYLDFMEGAFMVRVLPPWFSNTKKRLVKSPKVYIRDSGILHSLNAIDNWNNLINNFQVGASWEGYVIEQIINASNQDLTPSYYRTQQGAECDLILERGSSVKAAIEVKFSSIPKISKGFRISMEDTDAEKGYIICLTEENYQIEAGIWVCNLKYFMKDILPVI